MIRLCMLEILSSNEFIVIGDFMIIQLTFTQKNQTNALLEMISNLLSMVRGMAPCFDCLITSVPDHHGVIYFEASNLIVDMLRRK